MLTLLRCKMYKMLSGRFIFVVVTALAFAQGAATHYIPPDKLVEIVMIVVMAYFGRSDRTSKKGDTL